MKNIMRHIFVIVCMIICILPFAGMAVRPTQTTTENKKMAVFPDIMKENGKPNIHFLQELGTYFQEHFAFRLELVSMDAEIQSNVFKVSNADSIIAGSNGWLYYASTADSYLGKDLMTERNIKNIAHNLFMMQQYVKERGAEFIFTIPPDKNALYGENMPYYLQYKIRNTGNMDKLKREMETYGISYCDLFSLFKSQKEVLYLKKDSHWNNKGAVLAYNTILDQAGVKHDDYKNIDAVRLKNEYGDLNKMLYPVTAEPEWNYFYQKKHVFSYMTDTKSVEETWIETENKQGTDTLLMFRDSFGNTLLPLMADTFSKGYFSKGVPQNTAQYMEQYHPDLVILEKVQRNIKELAADPPLIEGKTEDLEGNIETVDTKTSMEIKESENDRSFLEISGILDNRFGKTDTEIYVNVKDDKDQTAYRTLYVTGAGSDYGYKLYFPKEKIRSTEILLEVIIKNGGKLQKVSSVKLDSQTPVMRNIEKERENNKPKIISKEKIYDCDGSGHGYYIIKWSDGREEYEDF